MRPHASVHAMTARLTIRERAATAAELAQLERSERATERGGFGCLLLAVLLCAVAFALASSAGWSLAAKGLLLLTILAGALAQNRSLKRYQRPHRWRLRCDLSAAVVEELELSGAEPVAIPGHHSSVEPAFAFACAGEQTVVVLGQYLGDPTTYGAPAESGSDTDDDTASGNGLPPPFAWPSERFTIHRFRRSGQVLRIDVQGAATPSRSTAGVVLNALNHHQSLLLQCNFADLQRAVDAMAEREAAEFEAARAAPLPLRHS